MADENLNTELYQKMSAEQEQRRALLATPIYKNTAT